MILQVLCGYMADGAKRTVHELLCGAATEITNEEHTHLRSKSATAIPKLGIRRYITLWNVKRYHGFSHRPMMKVSFLVGPGYGSSPKTKFENSVIWCSSSNEPVQEVK